MKKSSKLRRAYLEMERMRDEVDEYIFPQLARRLRNEVDKAFDRYANVRAQEEAQKLV